MSAIILTLVARHWKLAGVIAVGLIIFGAWQIDRRQQFNAGRDAERMAAIERAKELIEQRKKDDAAIDRLDDAGWCREFGYRLQSDGTCG